MPTRNSLSLISLGTPTSMAGLRNPSNATREPYRRKSAIGTLISRIDIGRTGGGTRIRAHALRGGPWSFTIRTRLSGRGSREKGRRMTFINRALLALPIAAIVTAYGLGPAAARTIDRLKQDKTLRIAYRDDAPPFSFTDAIGEAAGFMVDLCRSVAKNLASEL